MTVLNFPQQRTTQHVEELRRALWILIGDIEAFENCGNVKLNGIERHNVEVARRLLGDWRPREIRE